MIRDQTPVNHEHRTPGCPDNGGRSVSYLVLWSRDKEANIIDSSDVGLSSFESQDRYMQYSPCNSTRISRLREDELVPDELESQDQLFYCAILFLNHIIATYHNETNYFMNHNYKK